MTLIPGPVLTLPPEFDGELMVLQDSPPSPSAQAESGLTLALAAQSPGAEGPADISLAYWARTLR